jgi:hypothetical protein
MRSLKSVFGVSGALMPVIYCGGLLYYFIDLSESMDEATKSGLGPTELGLGAVGLLFCIPLLVKVVRFFGKLRSPASSGRGDPDASTKDDEKGFDADAVLARYMARQSAEVSPGAPAAPPAHEGGEAVSRPSFGRRIR